MEKGKSVDQKVGFIGLGVMGKPMARNLLRAGMNVSVHNRSSQAVDELVAEGARACRSPHEVGEVSDVIITMLPDSTQVQSVISGPLGVLDGAKPGALIIDMSTISPTDARALAGLARSRGVGFLDAPVSGGDVGAIEGTLSIMVGGTSGDFERARPLFEILGRTVLHVGESGAGQIVKACNQIVVALTIEAISEALVLGSKAGVSPELIVEALSGGLANSRVLELRGPNFLKHNFTPGGRVALHHKDLGIALTAARELGVTLPVTAIVDQLFQALEVKGHSSSDHSALLTLLEDLAEHSIRN